MLDLSKSPHFEVNNSNRLAVFFGLGGLFLVLYLLTNHLHVVEPRLFEVTRFDLGVPFLPWTSWIYVSDYVFPFAVGFLLRSPLVMTRLSLGFLIQTIVVNVTFALFPVRISRAEFQLNGQEDTWLLSLIRMIDTEANCFPSSHVAIVWLCTFAFHRERPKWSWIFALWAIAICWSTLTTKQHYVADVVSGTVVGMACYLAAERWIIQSKQQPR